MTDNEIIKALEYCIDYKENGHCENCPYRENEKGIYCVRYLPKNALDLINRQKAEIDDLFCKLTGVMHSVDKWLSVEELKQDEVSRAITMREKTLQIVEKRNAEIERLESELSKLKAEIDQPFLVVNTDVEATAGTIKAIKTQKVVCPYYEGTVEFLDKASIKAEAIKEFAEKIKISLDDLPSYSEEDFIYVDEFELRDKIDNLVKEMVGDSDAT